MPEAAEEISEKPEIRKELAQAASEKPREKVKARGTDKFWFVTHALLLVGCVVLYVILGSNSSHFHKRTSILLGAFYAGPRSL